LDQSWLSEAESEAVIQRLLTSFQTRAEQAVDEALEESQSVEDVLRLVGFEQELPAGFIPSRDVLVLLTTGRLLAEVDTESAPEQANELIASAAAEIYVAGMQKMADEAAGYAQVIESGQLPRDSQVESAIMRPGVLGRRAEKILKERGYFLTNKGASLWVITNSRSNQEVGLVRGGAKTALAWLYAHAWPEEWIDATQPDLGRPSLLTESEVARLLQLGIVGIFHLSGPDKEARGIQYFIDGQTNGEVIQSTAARLLL
jgi:hypothetical protein